MFRSTLIAAVFALSVGLVAGCGGNGDPKPKFADASDPSTPSPTMSASPKPETAAQFIRRWFAVGDRAQKTGDVREYNSLNDPHCGSCNGYARLVKRIYAAGGVVESSETKIRWIHKTATKDEYRVRTLSEASRYRESKSGLWKKLPGGSVTHNFELAHPDGQWLVVEYSEVSGSFAPLHGVDR